MIVADAGAPIVNEYHLKMSRGASCSNSFLRGDTFSNLFTPPLDLTERYYECVMPVGDAIFEALGAYLIAFVGNFWVYSPFLF